MVIMLILIYLGGWLAVTCAAYAARRRLADRESPPDHPMLVSFAAGAVWPLLVVGLVELSSIMVLTRDQPKPASKVGILA
jgi:Na+-transporting NADH:ubiquinone oxidoreductase subunit NqrE